MWQDAAFADWRSRLRDQVPEAARSTVDSLAAERQVVWLRRLAEVPHPVAAGIGRWISQLDDRPWTAAPADHWDLVEDSRSVVLAYPQYLGWDPLAMCGLGVIWAGVHDSRWQKLANFLGPAALLGAIEGRIDGFGVDEHFPSFRKAYADFLESWDLPPESVRSSDDLIWPAVPDYTQYQEQLAFGVVPHEVGGAGITSEVAVLLALRHTSWEARALMAGLAYKALEGLWMLGAWRRVR